MELFEHLGLAGNSSPTIDWELTPALTFTIFESWGSRYRVRSRAERYYYFYVDNWSRPAALFLMERGIRHARILARILAPQELIDRCVAEQGYDPTLDRTYAVNKSLRRWLRENVVEATDSSLVVPIREREETEPGAAGLPARNTPLPSTLPVVRLGAEPQALTESEVLAMIREGGFFDAERNPGGSFVGFLVDNGDALTVTDKRTGLMWQRGGCDITSIRRLTRAVAELNRSSFAGYDDWRLPTVEEALSLMRPGKNAQGLHLDPCFSKAQPFIFLAARNLPGGYWLADYLKGSVFWASGFNPGGFGRVCRTVG